VHCQKKHKFSLDWNDVSLALIKNRTALAM